MTGRGPISGWSRLAPRLACETALIDGEMVVQDERRITDFYALRSTIYTAPHRLVLFAFDLLHVDGQDLRG